MGKNLARSEPLRVIVKFSEGNIRGRSDQALKIKGREIELRRSSGTKRFKFEQVFGRDDGAAELHTQALSRAVQQAVAAGESITVLTFGAKGTGKTGIMRSANGLVMKVAQDVFSAKRDQECMVTVSCVLSAVTTSESSAGKQSTKEVLLDGLLPQGETGESYRGDLRVKEHPRWGYLVEGLTEIEVADLAECWEFLQLGIINSQLEEARCGTMAEGAPLRVHCMFKISVWHRGQDGETVVSQVQLCDLPGWFKDKRTESDQSASKKEDLVLKCFRKIVSQLEQGESQVSYRDSYLTRLLKPALGGFASCVVLVHVSPTNSSEETDAVLSLATKMQMVKNSVYPFSINFKSEDAKLRKDAQELASKTGTDPTMRSADIRADSENLKKLKDRLAALEQLEKDSLVWKSIQSASEAFKRDAGRAAAERRKDRHHKQWDYMAPAITDQEIEAMARQSSDSGVPSLHFGEDHLPSKKYDDQHRAHRRRGNWGQQAGKDSEEPQRVRQRGNQRSKEVDWMNEIRAPRKEDYRPMERNGKGRHQQQDQFVRQNSGERSHRLKNRARVQSLPEEQYHEMVLLFGEIQAENRELRKDSKELMSQISQLHEEMARMKEADSQNRVPRSIGLQRAEAQPHEPMRHHHAQNQLPTAGGDSPRLPALQEAKGVSSTPREMISHKLAELKALKVGTRNRLRSLT